MRIKSIIIIGSLILAINTNRLFCQAPNIKILKIQGDVFAIDKGKNNNIRINSIYIIFRNNMKIGEAKVINVRENVAALKLLSSKYNIRIGDYLVFDSEDEATSILNSYSPEINIGYNPHKYTTQKNIGRYGWASVAAITMIGSLSMGDKAFSTTVIPVVGPFITINRVENDPNATFLPGGKDLLMTSGILQVSFFTYWVYYLIKDSNYKSNKYISVQTYPNNQGFILSYNITF